MVVQTRAFGWLAAFLLPAAMTFATLRFLIPSRMDGGSAGLLALLARAGDEHPLLTGVALFALLGRASRYWLDRLRAQDGPPPGAFELPAAARRPTARFTVWLAMFAALALVARAKVAEIHRVVGASMAPTVNVGDRLLVNKLAYGLRVPFSRRVLGAKAPRRGDLIVFPNEGRDRGDAAPASLVKRVVGLPGDEVAFADGPPIINGWVVPSCDVGPFLTVAGTTIVRGRLAVEVLDDRSYLTIRSPLDGPRFARFKVPPGELFVLGDDRSVSSDSRSWNQGRGGGVRIDSIEGRVSRLAAVSRDGRLDLRHPFAGLRPDLRVTNVDVSKLERRIAACLAHPPRSSRPPLASTDRREPPR